MNRLMAVALVMVLAAAWPASAQTSLPPEPLVATQGEGMVMAAPDRGFVVIGAESRAPSPRDAQRRNADLMKPVHDKLKALGITGQAIRTVSIDLRPEFDFVNGKRVSRGYVAVNTIEVRIDAIDKLGEVLDAAVTAGATSISEVRFDVKDRAALEREALRLAVQDARARADAAAAGAGRTIDRVMRIDELGGLVQPPMPVRAMMMKDAAQMEATPVAPGQLEFRARVSLSATLK